MKHCHKALSLLLCAALLFSLCGVCALAEAPLPESDHDYANNLEQRWDYTYPGEARGLFVTFSEDTWVEEVSGWIIIDGLVDEKAGGVTVGGLAKNIFPPSFKTGDVIVIRGENDQYVGSYRGRALAGKTVFVPGRSFSVTLITDSSVTGYGFRVTAVEPCPDDYLRDVTFYPGQGNEAFTQTFERKFREKLASGITGRTASPLRAGPRRKAVPYCMKLPRRPLPPTCPPRCTACGRRWRWAGTRCCLLPTPAGILRWTIRTTTT